MNTTFRPTLLGMLGILLVTACGGAAPTPSANPSTSPGPTASPTTTGSPTTAASPTPTASPSPSPSPTFSGDAISHPTGPTQLVLQYDNVGGFVPPEFIVTQMPSFSLYGDGTVIIRPTEERGDRVLPQGALPRLIKATMTEEQVQALLRFALGQGRLLDAREHYPQNSCADCPTTIFRINAAGQEKTVAVDGLGAELQMDPADRQGFAALADTLMGFEQRALAGELGEVIIYEPTHYLVALLEAQPGQGEPVAWPWPELSLDDFVAKGDIDWRRDAVLTSEQLAALTEVPSGGGQGLFVEDADGDLWSVAFRPLLPNEGEEVVAGDR